MGTKTKNKTTSPSRRIRCSPEGSIAELPFLSLLVKIDSKLWTEWSARITVENQVLSNGLRRLNTRLAGHDFQGRFWVVTKIIADIAKGLAYFHEGCRQKIYHLDVKPQNILLDENFEAKVSDFGLAKLIDKDQSRIVAILRGTPGYMAPEWLSSSIIAKVDVYSFGVVVIEILCGLKNLDRSQPEEEMHLLGLFERKGKEGQLLDMVDKYNAAMQLHGAEVLEMMKLAVWCLQSDYQRRPSMTVAVQVLEGLVSVPDNLDYNFINAPARRTMADTGEDVHAIDDGTPLLASVLSGPR